MLRGFDPNPHVAHRFMTSCDDPLAAIVSSRMFTGGHPHKDIGRHIYVGNPYKVPYLYLYIPICTRNIP